MSTTSPTGCERKNMRNSWKVRIHEIWELVLCVRILFSYSTWKLPRLVK